CLIAVCSSILISILKITRSTIKRKVCQDKLFPFLWQPSFCTIPATRALEDSHESELQQYMYSLTVIAKSQKHSEILFESGTFCQNFYFFFVNISHIFENATK